MTHHKPKAILAMANRLLNTRPDASAAAALREAASMLRDLASGDSQPAQAVDVGYAPGELDRTAPERIWLQIDTNADNEDRHEPWPGTDGVTWQDESIGGLEIQYIRADLAARALSGEKAGPVGDVVPVAALRVLIRGNGGWASCFNDEIFVMWKDIEALLPACAAPDKEG